MKKRPKLPSSVRPSTQVGVYVPQLDGRKSRLSEIIREDIENERGVPIRAYNIQAIAELNKMEERIPVPDNRSINIIVSSDQGKDLVAKLLAGTKPGDEPDVT